MSLQERDQEREEDGARPSPRLVVDHKGEKPLAQEANTAEPGVALPDVAVTYEAPLEDRPAEPSSRGRPRLRRAAVTSARLLLQVGLTVAILVAAFLGAQRIIATAPEGPERPRREPVLTVETGTAIPRTVRPDFIAYGTVAAPRAVDLRAPVAGEIVTVAPGLAAGARVDEGQTLVEIDRFDYEAAVAEAEANLVEAQARLTEIEAQIASERDAIESAREQLTLAEEDLARALELRERGTGTQREVDERRTLVSQRRATVTASENALGVAEARLAQQRPAIDRLEVRLAQARRTLDDTALRAPFDAVVREESAEIGRTVTAADTLVSLYALEDMEVRFLLTDRQFARLAADRSGIVGRDVRVRPENGSSARELLATIARIGPEVDSERGGVEVFARMEEAAAERLRPGAFVEVVVPDREYAQAVVLPESALYGGDHVYVVEDGRLARRAVGGIAYAANDVLVTEGLTGGETVLVTRISDIREGLLVETAGAASTSEPVADGSPAAERSASEAVRDGNATAAPEEPFTDASVEAATEDDARGKLPRPEPITKIGPPGEGD